MVFSSRATIERFLEAPAGNSGKSKTEQVGYLSPKIQIQQMLRTGRNINDYRRSVYDFASDEEVDENYYDVTRDKNFDLVDAQKLQEQKELILQNVREGQRLEKERLKAEFEKQQKEEKAELEYFRKTTPLDKQPEKEQTKNPGKEPADL
ncbi:MAG: hypothetical protein Ta2B_10580 [Termitinemataceae bacterium]|nr:MAG: hypothetical protein Ta2B_10580 [Termitinemataceae bacterium]